MDWLTIVVILVAAEAAILLILTLPLWLKIRSIDGSIRQVGKTVRFGELWAKIGQLLDERDRLATRSEALQKELDTAVKTSNHYVSRMVYLERQLEEMSHE